MSEVVLPDIAKAIALVKTAGEALEHAQPLMPNEIWESYNLGASYEIEQLTYALVRIYNDAMADALACEPQED